MIELQPTTYQLILYYTTHSTRKQSLSLSTNRTDGLHTLNLEYGSHVSNQG
jgi:hypothetical protein